MWYKLGNGFGKKDNPTNINTVLRARIVLSSNISHNVTEIYNHAKEMHKNGEITNEQLAARIIMLRNKPLLPEELEGDSIEDSMDFTSDYVYRFEQEINENKNALQEKEKEIEIIKKQNQIIVKQKDDIISEKNLEIEKQNKENEALTFELKKYKEKEELQQKTKEKKKRILKISWSIIWRVILVLLITFLTIIAYKNEKDALTMFLAITDILGLSIMGFNAGKKFKATKKKQ